jgi:hypothetical protein
MPPGDRENPDLCFIAPMPLEESRWYLQSLENKAMLFARKKTEVGFSPIDDKTWQFGVLLSIYSGAFSPYIETVNVTGRLKYLAAAETEVITSAKRNLKNGNHPIT